MRVSPIARFNANPMIKQNFKGVTEKIKGYEYDPPSGIPIQNIVISDSGSKNPEKEVKHEEVNNEPYYSFFSDNIMNVIKSTSGYRNDQKIDKISSLTKTQDSQDTSKTYYSGKVYYADPSEDIDVGAKIEESVCYIVRDSMPTSLRLGDLKEVYLENSADNKIKSDNDCKIQNMLTDTIEYYDRLIEFNERKIAKKGLPNTQKSSLAQDISTTQEKREDATKILKKVKSLDAMISERDLIKELILECEDDAEKELLDAQLNQMEINLKTKFTKLTNFFKSEILKINPKKTNDLSQK